MGKKNRIKLQHKEIQGVKSGCPYCESALDTHHINLPDYKRYYQCGTPATLKCRGIVCRLNSIETQQEKTDNDIENIFSLFKLLLSEEVIQHAKKTKKEKETQDLPMVQVPRVLRKNT